MSIYGVCVKDGTTRFRVRSPSAEAMWVCLFDGEIERRYAMQKEGADWTLSFKADLSGARYGLRANGRWSPETGMYFDPSKLLVDPYAILLDQRFVQDSRLAQFGVDTAAIVPKAIIPNLQRLPLQTTPVFRCGGLIYEINVRAFTIMHPELPPDLRGTVGALAHPVVLAHLKKLNVNAIELMPIVAWIDERHLPPLRLTNGWGYNPVAMMALEPALCPNGIEELRETVAVLNAENIGVILDLVFNHTGESDAGGGVLSLRGLDNSYYAQAPDGALINDTGCGNTLNFANPITRALALDTMRHFVKHAGVDGFRFDLATVMARGPAFDPCAPIFAEIGADPLLSDRILIAEPWDVGPGGYQLGKFPKNWLEWNDRFRDDVRQFWKAETGIGLLATRMAGSSDIFTADGELPHSRSVNFLAAHDGFTLVDTVAYREKHNLQNGEGNRDGHAENHSWNYGIEGPTDNLLVKAERNSDIRAMLGTLFASTGTIMLTAGDEFGRTQGGNNNAYCQDNAITWLDWAGRDRELEDFVAALSRVRAAHLNAYSSWPSDTEWFDLNGRHMTVDEWQRSDAAGFRYTSKNLGRGIIVDRCQRRVEVHQAS